MRRRSAELQDRSAAALAVWRLLTHGFGLLLDAAEKCTLEYGLTLPQFQVLEILFRRQPLSQSQLVENLSSSAGNVSQIVSNLQRKELIMRARDPADGRYRIVTLTQVGQRIFEAAYPPFLAAISELADLSPDELSALQGLTSRFTQPANARSFSVAVLK
jgi:MarR family 2-MHQ and catechol resistance regulon transcriptional repressor